MRRLLTITVALLLTHQPVMPQELAMTPMRAIKIPMAPPTLSPDCRTKRFSADPFRPPLRALSRAVRAKRQVRVLAIGSSSTAGVGASSQSATYIAKLETSLEGSLQGMDFDVLGRGLSGEVAQGAADRMKHEVEETKPDLVVWELGTNDALRHVSLDKFKSGVRTTLAWLAEEKIDVVLIDPQYGEALTTDTYYEEMVGAVAEVAREAGVLRVARFEAMRELQQERGDLFYLSSDQLYPNDRGHRCMAEQLARAIVGGLMQADAEQTQPAFRGERAEHQLRKADQDAQRQADAAASVKKAEEEVQARARAEAETKRRADDVAKRQEETKQRAKEEEWKREVWKPPLDRVLTAVEEERMKPGDEFQECKYCPRMIVVPAGSFMMGSNDGDADEKPMHKVAIARPFAVGKFDVTFAEWDACVADGGCKHMPRDRGWGRGTRPVINVSWDDIMKEYLPWLSRKTGKIYRLLTEAEWEYAARGVIDASAVHTNYSWGNDVGKNLANCNGCGSHWDAKQSAPVGSFKPNTFGLYDIHGNVRQWVQDCYHDSYEGAPADGSAWITSCTEGSRRVLRGGSWHVDPQDLRAAYRVANSPGKRIDAEPAHSAIIDDDGFRVARTLTKDEVTQEAANSAIKNSMPSRPVVAIERTPAPARCDGVEVQVGSESKCLKPRDSFRDCPTCPEMVVVGAGSFTMGSPSNEPGRYNDEEQVRVTIAAPFAAGKYAVSFEEWDACVSEGGATVTRPMIRDGVVAGSPSSMSVGMMPRLTQDGCRGRPGRPTGYYQRQSTSS